MFMNRFQKVSRRSLLVNTCHQAYSSIKLLDEPTGHQENCQLNQLVIKKLSAEPTGHQENWQLN
jgi:hypothetical protein